MGHFTCKKNQDKILEKHIHMYLNIKNKFLNTLHSHDEEWFHLSLDQLDSLLDVILTPFEQKYNGHTLFPYQTVNDNTYFLFANEEVGQSRVKGFDKKSAAYIHNSTTDGLSTTSKMTTIRKFIKKHKGRTLDFGV